MTDVRTSVGVTIVIPTYRRASLARTLDGVAVQRADIDYEVIVVDNDPGASAADIVSAYGGRISGRLRHVVEPRPGSANARNRGIAEADAPLIALLDDDVEPAPDWLERLVGPIRDDRADATGGCVVLDPAVPRPRWFDERGVGGYLTSFDLGDAEREITGREYLVTANAAFRTELLRRTGGFDVTLGPRGGVHLVGDDVHVVREAQRLGGRVHYVPDAIVVHELPAGRLRPSWVLRRAWWQGRSDWTVDATELSHRRLGGARVALHWYADELARRRSEGLYRLPVAFHALCDTARTAGALAGAVELARRTPR